MDDSPEGPRWFDSLTWRPYGEHGVLIEVGALSRVHALYRSVRGSDVVAECVPGAETLFIRPSNPALSHSDLLREVIRLAALPSEPLQGHQRTHHVDVVYDGIDLCDVAELAGLTVADVVRRHCEPTYTVAFLGFSRAFPYLSGLDPLLIVPRLSSPRPRVPSGSVGMGAGFTGIYPASTPGGWRLLGRTADVFFDETREPPSVLAPGDLLRFRAVSS